MLVHNCIGHNSIGQYVAESLRPTGSFPPRRNSRQSSIPAITMMCMQADVPDGVVFYVISDERAAKAYLASLLGAERVVTLDVQIKHFAYCSAHHAQTRV